MACTGCLLIKLLLHQLQVTLSIYHELIDLLLLLLQSLQHELHRFLVSGLLLAWYIFDLFRLRPNDFCLPLSLHVIHIPLCDMHLLLDGRHLFGNHPKTTVNGVVDV